MASSAAATSRRPAARAAKNVSTTRPNAMAQRPNTNAGSNEGVNPRSNTCWTSTGVTRVETVTPSETTTVSHKPRRSSGLSRSPRRSTAQVPSSSLGIGRPSSATAGSASRVVALIAPPARRRG